MPLCSREIVVTDAEGRTYRGPLQLRDKQAVAVRALLSAGARPAPESEDERRRTGQPTVAESAAPPAEGDDVPRHSHDNEQITYILHGALQFWFGADDGREIIVRAGEVLVIPSNVPHRALALEDTLDVDIFNPPRQDWLAGTDAYLRAGA